MNRMTERERIRRLEIAVEHLCQLLSAYDAERFGRVPFRSGADEILKQLTEKERA